MNHAVVFISGAFRASFDAVSIRSAKSRVIKYLESQGVACCHLVPLPPPGIYTSCSCCSSASVRVHVLIKMGNY